MIVQELRLQDAESFRKYLRMNTAVFEEKLLSIAISVLCKRRKVSSDHLLGNQN